MKTLVFLEHHDGVIGKGSLGVLSKAASLDSGEVAAALVGGTDLGALAEQAGSYGAAMVYLAEDEALGRPLPQPRVDVLADVVRQGSYDTVLFANSVLAADIAAGLAARLDAGLNCDLVDLVDHGGELTGKRLALEDALFVETRWSSMLRIAVFRAGTCEAVERAGASPTVEALAVTLEDHSAKAMIVEQRPATDSGPSIEHAEIVVSGGMGLGSAENFVLAEDLAAALGGAVGATRAVVYAGWYPRSAQVGQTGKTVSPKLYIALGISGAIQHKVGMQNSKVIVAINKDPSAPIFEFSDLSVVGDVHEVVPTLIELIRKRKSS